MLAVVEPEAVALERVRRAAEARADLEQRHGRAARRRSRAPPRSRRGRRRRRPTTRARLIAPPRPGCAAATHVFSHGGQRDTALEHRLRVALDALEEPAVDAGHRRTHDGAAPVEQRRAARGRGRTTRARARPRSAISCANGVRAARSSRSSQPNRAQVLARAGRRGRASRSSRTSRRMLVSCIATPRSSASGSAARRVAGAEDRQAQAADRAGDPPAVDDELVEGLVAARRARPSRRRRSDPRARRAAARSAARRRRSATAPGPPVRRRELVARGREQLRACARPDRRRRRCRRSRRANAYTAHIARRFGGGQQPDPVVEVRARCSRVIASHAR